MRLFFFRLSKRNKIKILLRLLTKCDTITLQSLTKHRIKLLGGFS